MTFTAGPYHYTSDRKGGREGGREGGRGGKERGREGVHVLEGIGMS